MKLLSHHPATALIGAAISLVALLYGGLDTIGDTKTYTEHAWAWYVFGADFVLFAIILARAAMQGRTNRSFDERLEHAIQARLKLAGQVGVLEGTVKERGVRLALHRKMLDALRDRTVILRDCDEDHEKRLQVLENKFRLTHDQAVARVALRGRAFDDQLEGDLAEDKNK